MPIRTERFFIGYEISFCFFWRPHYRLGRELFVEKRKFRKKKKWLCPACGSKTCRRLLPFLIQLIHARLRGLFHFNACVEAVFTGLHRLPVVVDS
jgi:hypothetical protein